MTKFKKGDEILCIHASGTLVRDRVYTVLSVDEKGMVRVRTGAWTHFFFPERFELVTDEEEEVTKFKKGDFVVCVNDTNSLIKGEPYVVSEVEEVERFGFESPFVNIRLRGFRDFYASERFELAEVPEFKKGDEVVCIRSTSTLREGVKFTILDVREDGLLKLHVGIGWSKYFYPHRFKLATNEEEEVTKFKKGDEVYAVESTSGLIKGKSYTVENISISRDVKVEGLQTYYLPSRFKMAPKISELADKAETSLEYREARKVKYLASEMFRSCDKMTIPMAVRQACRLVDKEIELSQQDADLLCGLVAKHVGEKWEPRKAKSLISQGKQEPPIFITFNDGLSVEVTNEGVTIESPLGCGYEINFDEVFLG